MEDALKARLIGASILVLLAVALLPELLSGPKPLPGAAGGAAGKGTRTITIDLGGTVAAGSQVTPRPDTVPAPTAAATTLPAVESPAATTAAPDNSPEPLLAKPTAEPHAAAREPVVTAPAASTPLPTAAIGPKPAPAPVPAPKANAGAGGFAVQVGAFGSAAGARKLVNDLQADGLPAYLLQPAPGKKLHRVRVGPVPDRAAADKLAAKLKSRGLPVAVVTDG